jgi:hypothetical protein
MHEVAFIAQLIIFLILIEVDNPVEKSYSSLSHVLTALGYSEKLADVSIQFGLVNLIPKKKLMP